MLCLCGSAITAILLSIALADKITVLRREKEISQARALQISQENEKLVREQNMILKQKVAQRTKELQSSQRIIRCIQRSERCSDTTGRGRKNGFSWFVNCRYCP